MSHSSPFRCPSAPVSSFILLVLAAVAPGQQVTRQPAKIGDIVPDHQFKDPIAHGGRDRISDWFGHPVLVFGWRGHLLEGLHAAKPAFELHSKLGKRGLVLIGTDRHDWRGKPGHESATFWLGVTGHLPMICSVPATRPKDDLPLAWNVPRDERSMALIGVDGRLLALGSLEDLKQQRAPTRRKFEKLAAAEVKRRRSGWGEDAVAKKARALAFGKDQLGKALASLDAVEEAERSAEQALARAEIERHLATRKKAIAWWREKGQPLAAQEAMKDLAKAIRGQTGMEQACAALFASLSTAAFKQELALDRRLQKLLAPVLGVPRKGRAKAELLGQLRKLARRHPDSPVGKRAAYLDRRVHSMLCTLLGMKWKEVEAKAEG